MVLVISFVALAILWPEPRLEGDRWRPLPGGIGRVLGSRPVEIVCGAIGVALLGVVVYTGLQGTQSPAANFAPTFVFVIFWIGLVPVSEDSQQGGRLEELHRAGTIVRYAHGDLSSLGEACERALATSTEDRRRIYEHFNRHETVGTVVADAIAAARA